VVAFVDGVCVEFLFADALQTEVPRLQHAGIRGVSGPRAKQQFADLVSAAEMRFPVNADHRDFACEIERLGLCDATNAGRVLKPIQI